MERRPVRASGASSGSYDRVSTVLKATFAVLKVLAADWKGCLRRFGVEGVGVAETTPEMGEVVKPVSCGLGLRVGVANPGVEGTLRSNRGWGGVRGDWC